MLFRPEDPNDLHQILAAGKKSVLSNAGEKAAFRFPSPGSITGARVPHLESSDHVYDTKFFTHDPANLPSKVRPLFNFQSIVIFFHRLIV